MLILFSYPELFGVADNNGYGLKVFAYLKIVRLAFEHRHIFDASTAPRGQLPYIVDGDEVVGDSDAIIAHVARRHGADLDSGLSAAQRQLGLMLRRTLDDLYWVMSYSRWKDEAFWPAFCAALLAQHPSLTVEGLEKARSFNANRYYFQGIGRFEPHDAYARGLADLEAIANLVPEKGFLFGERPTSADAAVYGFIANIYFYPIETPLRRYVMEHPHLSRHCEDMHALVML
ncbi:MAG: glutathione S-transferase family protein [Hyphomicrobiales bacterium]|uniref:glutathione S-transferase family protein n=1 Tax=Aestuariivirga sp. TaxID=2650926 RepID=UPI0035B0D8E3